MRLPSKFLSIQITKSLRTSTLSVEPGLPLMVAWTRLGHVPSESSGSKFVGEAPILLQDGADKRRGCCVPLNGYRSFNR